MSVARKFTIDTIEFQDFDTDFIGISKDNWLEEVAPGSEHGTADRLWVGETGNNFHHIVIEIVMPENADIPSLDVLLKTELMLYSQAGGADPVLVAVIKIGDIWDETQSSWDEAQDSVPWEKGVGAIESREGSLKEGEEVIEATWVTTVAVWNLFDLTPELSLGDTKTVVLFPLKLPVANAWYRFYSRDEASALTLRPKIRLTFKDYSPDVFTSEEDQLTIEPYENNPEQPFLKWGGTDAPDFERWKIWRETSPITDVSLLTPIVTITDPSTTEYVDVGSLIDGTKYYYLVTCEDGNNTGNNATFSKNVSFTKPDVATASMSPSGAQNVGTQVTLAVTSPQNIKRVYVDWKDGIKSWYEFDLPETSKSVTHVYANDSGGALTPDVRIEDDLGFWSSLTPTSNNITVNDTTPNAKLLINVKRDHVGVEITLNAALSQPAGSNVTITKYEFKRYTGDSWNDNGTDPIFSFSTTGFSVGSKTAELRITTSTALQDTDTVDYDLEAGDPVELIFSRNTRIHEIAHDLTLDKDFRAPLEGEGVEFQFKTARRAERITVNGTSHTPDMDTDMGIIRDVWDNDTYIRLRVKNEVEGKDVLYDGKLESDVTQGHSYPNLQTWSFNMVVFDRTEV